MKKQLDVTNKKFNFLSLHWGGSHGYFFLAPLSIAIGQYGPQPHTSGPPCLLTQPPNLVCNEFIYNEVQSHCPNAPAIIEANFLISDNYALHYLFDIESALPKLHPYKPHHQTISYAIHL